MHDNRITTICCCQCSQDHKILFLKTPLGTRKTRIFTLLPSPPAFNISPDNESKRDAHPQDIGMSRPPHGGARESTLSQVPHFYRVSFSKRPFCQGIASKKFPGKPAKFFAPLTTTKNSIINTRAERFPAPRLNCKTAPLSSPSPPRLLVCTCSHLIYPLADGSLLPP